MVDNSQSQPPAGSLGSVIRSMREARGWTIEDYARRVYAITNGVPTLFGVSALRESVLSAHALYSASWLAALERGEPLSSLSDDGQEGSRAMLFLALPFMRDRTVNECANLLRWFAAGVDGRPALAPWRPPPDATSPAIRSVSYRRLVSLPGYNHEAVEASADVRPGDEPMAVLAGVEEFVRTQLALRIGRDFDRRNLVTSVDDLQREKARLDAEVDRTRERVRASIRRIAEDVLEAMDGTE